MQLNKINTKLKKEIKLSIPKLEKILDDDMNDCHGWRKFLISPFKKTIHDDHNKLDEILHNNTHVIKSANLINVFTNEVLNNFMCYYLGHENKYGQTIFDEDINIYDQIYEITHHEKSSIKYHMPEFGRPKYNIIITDLDAVYCESFDLINVIYIKNDSKKISILTEYVVTNNLHIFGARKRV